jgi:uncharacterized protein (DUF58 family)
MPTKRGWAALVAGLSLWVAARLIGSPDLHMVSVGIFVLPFLAALFVRWSRVRLGVKRHLSTVRVFPGSRVTVSLTVENRGSATAPFVLLEDALPSALGKPARVVVSGIPPGNEQTVSYSVLCRSRGRFAVGPLSLFISDPFGLARVRIQHTEESELIVYPHVEDIEAGRLATQGAGTGDSAVRHLYRSAAEFYTMREYVTGDDLRRIHWPSVARTGKLMIRQDESTRRAAATIFLDNRGAALGEFGSPGFERAISVAASVGRALIRAGFALRLAMSDTTSHLVSEDLFLETLAGAAPARTMGLAESLKALRAGAFADTTLAVVCAPLPGTEVAALQRVGSGFGRKLAVFVNPFNPSSLAPDAAAELQGRATAGRATLQRAGWDIYLVNPDGRLREAWQSRGIKKLQVAGTSS